MNTKFFKYIIPALSLVFSVNFTSCLGDLDVTPIDPNLNVEFDQMSFLRTRRFALGLATWMYIP